MSLKPTKKTDLNKEWLKGRESKNKKIMINPEYHLIITEGTNTEPLYFESIKKEINEKYRDRIHVEIEGTGENTLNLFQRAKKKAEKSPNVFKHIWIVYDTDDFPFDQINQTVDLCASNSTDDTEYHALWSNQCIELWFLLHFGFYHSDIHRKEYFPKLTKHLSSIGKGDYKKNRGDMYNILKPYLKKAMSNANKLAKLNENKTASDSTPGTEVYKIIEKLTPFLEL